MSQRKVTRVSLSSEQASQENCTMLKSRVENRWLAAVCREPEPGPAVHAYLERGQPKPLEAPAPVDLESN